MSSRLNDTQLVLLSAAWRPEDPMSAYDFTWLWGENSALATSGGDRIETGRSAMRKGSASGAAHGERAPVSWAKITVADFGGTGVSDCAVGNTARGTSGSNPPSHDFLHHRIVHPRPPRRCLKVVWHDGQGACLFTKRLERGRFLWPSVADGVVTISAPQLGYLLSGIDWRMPQKTWRPTAAG